MFQTSDLAKLSWMQPRYPVEPIPQTMPVPALQRPYTAPRRLGDPLHHFGKGQATDLRERVFAAGLEFQSAVKPIGAFIKALIARRGRSLYRPEHFKFVIDSYKANVPDFPRIGVAFDGDKKHLCIADVRLFTCESHHETWAEGDFEPGFILQIYQLIMKPGIYKLKPITLAVISKLAMARRYRYGFDNSDQAILQDVGVIALNIRDVLDKPIFELPTSSGVWIGRTVTHNNGKRCLAIRAFNQTHTITES